MYLVDQNSQGTCAFISKVCFSSGESVGWVAFVLVANELFFSLSGIINIASQMVSFHQDPLFYDTFKLLLLATFELL